jgi:hypothetical protein
MLHGYSLRTHISNSDNLQDSNRKGPWHSTTSLNEAINMTRIITIYGCDGPNRSAEVIAEVAKIQQADALGASALESSFNHGPMTILLSIIKLESCTRPMFIIFYH